MVVIAQTFSSQPITYNYSATPSHDCSNSQLNPSNNKLPATEQQPLQFVLRDFIGEEEETEVEYTINESH